MKLKTYTRSLCQCFVKEPKFLQSTLQHNAKCRNLRLQNFEALLMVCDLMKEKGNTLYKLQQDKQAIEFYERVYTVFEYIEQSDNQKLYIIQFQGSNEDQKLQIRDIKKTILNNLAATYLRLNLFEEAIQSTNKVLQIDPQQPKALYRRGKARIALEKSAQNYDLSIEDLNQAYKYQADPLIEKDLQEFVNARALIKDNFWDQFQFNNPDFNYELSYEEDVSRTVPQEVHELGKFIESKGEEMINNLKNQGRDNEIEELRDQLTKAIAAKKQLEKISRLDFSKPKPYLQEVATKLGIDLLEDQIQNEFKRIQDQNIQDIRQKLKDSQWNYQSQGTTPQGSQGEQRTYPKEVYTNKYRIYIGMTIILFVLIGVFCAGT